MLQKKNSTSGSLFANGAGSGVRSIDYGIPLSFPDKMMSNYSELNNQRPHQEEEDQRQVEREVSQIENEDAEDLEQLLNLKKEPIIKKLSQEKATKSPAQSYSPVKYQQEQQVWGEELPLQPKFGVYEDTKNLLRNFGNAQNQFILYNQRAKAIVEQSTFQAQRFNMWVRTLKLQNFEQFKQVWGGSVGNKLFTRLYKQLCWKFYVQEAMSYVLMSRMKNEVTKMTHLKYICRFLEGIKDPGNFKYFKKQ